jgi:putative transposase
MGTGIAVLRTPIMAPRANAIGERLLGSVRRECLDHILILSESHLRRILSEYALYYNRARPHQGIGQRPPESGLDRSGSDRGEIVGLPILGGLHHDYRRIA